MNNALLREIEKIFEDQKKWDDFLELYEVKDKIVNHWITKLNQELRNQFQFDDSNQKWAYKNINNDIRDCRWYLKEFGENSLCLAWEIFENGKLSLWSSGSHNSEKIFSLLQQDRYKPLHLGFGRIDKFDGKGYQLIEWGNFNFGDEEDGSLKTNKLAWYAGNRTEEFLEQLTAKINRFRHDELLTSLLEELNESTKI